MSDTKYKHITSNFARAMTAKIEDGADAEEILALVENLIELRLNAALFAASGKVAIAAERAVGEVMAEFLADYEGR